MNKETTTDGQKAIEWGGCRRSSFGEKAGTKRVFNAVRSVVYKPVSDGRAGREVDSVKRVPVTCACSWWLDPALARKEYSYRSFPRWALNELACLSMRVLDPLICQLE